jgi:hypothetical protein
VVLTLEPGEGLYSLHNKKKQAKVVADFVREIDFFALEDYVRGDSGGSLAKKIMVECECANCVLRCIPGREVIVLDKFRWVRWRNKLFD